MSKVSLNVNQMTTWLLCVGGLLALIPSVTPVIRCYSCTSYITQCQESVNNAHGGVYRERCKNKCFVRLGEDDAVYRGCSDDFRRIPTLHDNYVGCRNQTWNNRRLEWCFCDSDLCNGINMETMGRQTLEKPIQRPRVTTPSSRSLASRLERQPDKIDPVDGVQDDKGSVNGDFNYIKATSENADTMAQGPESDLPSTASSPTESDFTTVQPKLRKTKQPMADRPGENRSTDEKDMPTEKHDKVKDAAKSHKPRADYKMKSYRFRGGSESVHNDGVEYRRPLHQNDDVISRRPNDDIISRRQNNVIPHDDIRREDRGHSGARKHGDDGNANGRNNLAPRARNDVAVRESNFERKPENHFNALRRRPNNDAEHFGHRRAEKTFKAGHENDNDAESYSTNDERSEVSTRYEDTTKHIATLMHCTETGFYSHPTNCRQFVACVFDPLSPEPVLHLMRCPAHLEFDDERKICVAYSLTCRQGTPNRQFEREKSADDDYVHETYMYRQSNFGN